MAAVRPKAPSPNGTTALPPRFFPVGSFQNRQETTGLFVVELTTTAVCLFPQAAAGADDTHGEFIVSVHD